MHKGLWTHSELEPHDITEVAVKLLKNTANETEKIQFLQEAAIMGQFDHPYIIQIFGILATNGKVHVVTTMGYLYGFDMRKTW